MSSDRSGRVQSSAAWIALGVAFLPVLADLMRHFTEASGQREFLLAPLLFLLCVRCDTSRAVVPHRDGLFLLFAAVALQFVGIASHTALVGRLALALAVVGMARWRGSPKLSIAVLAFGVVPVPGFAFEYTTPSLESLWGSAAAQFVQLFGGEISVSGPLFRSAAGRFELTATDGGLPLLKILVELGWYSGVRQELSGRALLRRVGLGAVLAGPIQLLGVTAAVFLFAFGLPDVARILLDHGLWLGAAAWVVWRVERRAR
jgi:hypothetical protein